MTIFGVTKDKEVTFAFLHVLGICEVPVVTAYVFSTSNKHTFTRLFDWQASCLKKWFFLLNVF